MEHFSIFLHIQCHIYVNSSNKHKSLNTHTSMCLNLILLHICPPTGQPANGRLKSRTKNVFFHKNNAVGHVAFVGRPTMSAGLITHV